MTTPSQQSVAADSADFVIAQNRCWALLRDAEMGRIALMIEGYLEIIPLNFAVDHGTLVFRTGASSRLAGLPGQLPVAFEADGRASDDAGEMTAWSVVVHGHIEHVGGGELLNITDLVVNPGQSGPKGTFVRLVVTHLSGREFPLADPGVWTNPVAGARRSADE